MPEKAYDVEKDVTWIQYVSIERDCIPLCDFYGDNEIERKASNKAKEYLTSKGMNLGDFFIIEIVRPDSIINPFVDDGIGPFSVGINLHHQIDIDYIDSLNDVNKKLVEQHKGEEWIPIIPPPTGSFMGRVIFYYLEQDSIFDARTQ